MLMLPEPKSSALSANDDLFNGSLGVDVEGGSAAEKPVSMSELLSNKGVQIGCAIFLLQQFSGINAIVYFSSSVFGQVYSPFPLTSSP